MDRGNLLARNHILSCEWIGISVKVLPIEDLRTLPSGCLSILLLPNALNRAHHLHCLIPSTTHRTGLSLKHGISSHKE